MEGQRTFWALHYETSLQSRVTSSIFILVLDAGCHDDNYDVGGDVAVVVKVIVVDDNDEQEEEQEQLQKGWNRNYSLQTKNSIETCQKG